MNDTWLKVGLKTFFFLLNPSVCFNVFLVLSDGQAGERACQEITLNPLYFDRWHKPPREIAPLPSGGIICFRYAQPTSCKNLKGLEVKGPKLYLHSDRASYPIRVPIFVIPSQLFHFVPRVGKKARRGETSVPSTPL